MHRITGLVLLITFFVIASCSNEQTCTVEEIDGVRHVHNLVPLWGDEQKIRLEHVQTIGGIDAEDENFQFYSIRGAVKDSKGNIFVLDAGNHRVQKFDKNGNFLLSFGQKGQGPGEFNMPRNILILSDDTIFVNDMRKWHWFTADGNLIESKLIQKLTLRGILLDNKHHFSHLGFQHYVEEFYSKVSDKPYLISELDENGELVSGFGEIFHYENNRAQNIANMIAISKDPGSNIYAGFYWHNRIEKYSQDGNLIMRIDRPLSYPIEYEMATYRPVIDGEAREYEFAEFNRVTDGIAVDNKGRIWARTIKKQLTREDRERKVTERVDYTYFLELFSPEGVLLTTIEPDISLSGLRIFGDRILTHSNDESCVFEYRIIDLE